MIDNHKIMDFAIPLFDGGLAVISIPYPLSKENLELIRKWLIMFEEALTANKEG